MKIRNRAPATRILSLALLSLATATTGSAESYRGDMNSWGTSWMTQDTDFGSIWKVAVTSAATDATSAFQFDQDGDWDPQWGTGSKSTNATKNATFGQAHADLDPGNPSPGNLSFSATAGKHYTFSMNGDSTWWYRLFVIHETDTNPVTIAAVSDDHESAGTNIVTVTVQLSAAKSPQEAVWVRYTTNGWTSSRLTAQAGGSSTNYTASIPACATGTVVEFYLLTSTMPSNRITDQPDLCTLRGKKAGATNYQYYVGAPPPDLGNGWHIPSNVEPYTVTMRNPVEAPATNQDVYIYNGNQFQGAGNTGDQSGGVLYYRRVGDVAWLSTNLSYDNQDGNNKYWKSRIPAGTFGATNEVEYYLKISYTDHDDTYIGTTNNGAGSLAYAAEAEARTNTFAFTYSDAEGSSAAWMWHNNNRVTIGSNAQCWVKIGYAQGTGTNRWVDYAAIYYTTNGADPGGACGEPTNASTMVIAMTFDHMEEDSYAGADAMWWQGMMTNLPGYTTIRYRIGSWKTTNDTERFADYGTSGTNNAIFSFALGVLGDPELTVDGLSANYTTTKRFINEAAGETQTVVVVFKPGVANLDKVEIFSNLDRRDYCDTDYTNAFLSADGYPDGIRPPDGNYITTNDTAAYYTAWPMIQTAPGEYVWTGTISRCGAYRLTARFTTNGMAANTWHWCGDYGQRDHAIVVSPKKVLEQTMYELNTLTVESTDSDEAHRSTFVDLLGAADGDTDGFDAFNLDYLNFIQANCLWFQPIHPNAQERKDGFTPGSPYATRDYFAVTRYMGAAGTEAGAMEEFTNFVATCDAYAGSVGTINVMLDGVFNHTSWDAEFGQGGLDLGFCTNANDRIGWFRPTWYALITDYGLPATFYHGAYDNDYATAPDRGDFGKWFDVCELYFGKYSALVRHNPDNNGDYLNEGDQYDHYGMVETNEMDLWRFFAYYTEYWLEKTGHPGTNTWVAAQDDKGIDGLRCDFGQGLPPQCWEYIINRTRRMKWNFLFMAETLDGGVPGYRSNRHFDILNENLVFQFTQGHVNDSWDIRSSLESRRSTYNGGTILLNLTSHDEVLPDNDCWLVATRYGALSTVDGIPMLFYGQEQGIQNYNSNPSYWYYDGFRTDHEENFGKFVPHFKQWNQLVVWSNPPPNNGGLAQWYGRVNWARRNSPALQSRNRYFLSKAGGGDEGKILAVAKYQTPYASPATSDVVLAFALLFRHGEAQAGASATYDLQGAWDLMGMNTGKYYNVRNLASSDAGAYLWSSNVHGSVLYNNGLWVNLQGGTSGPITNDGELVQYLKVDEFEAANHAPVLDVPGPHTLPVGATTNFQVTASDDDGDPVVITNPVAPAGATFDGTNFSWTAGAADCNTTNPLVFVANDQQGDTNSVVTNTTQIVVPFDWDADGMSDGWEWANFATLTNPGTGDVDADGTDNYTECVAGTQPTNAGSVFELTAIASSAGGTSRTVTVATEPARQYTIYYADTIVTSPVAWFGFGNTNDGVGTWAETSTVSSWFTFTDDETANTSTNPPANDHRFYRVKVRDP